METLKTTITATDQWIVQVMQTCVDQAIKANPVGDVDKVVEGAQKIWTFVSQQLIAPSA